VRRVAEEARSFFATANQPFFLKVSYLDPHVDASGTWSPAMNQVLGIPERPLTAADISINTWTGQPVSDIEKPEFAAYYNCVQRVDEGVGLLMQALDESGFADNTMVILLGDNGPETAQGGKADIFENGLAVPMLIRYPTTGKSGQVRSELVSEVDILPTILEAAGLAVPPTIKAMMTEGRSLLPIIKGDVVAGWRKYLFAEMNYHTPEIYRPGRSVRDSRYKLIKSYPPLARGINGLTLFDLKNDRLETRNLVGNPAYGAILNRLLTQLANWQLRTGDRLLAPGSSP
jgi:N-sulfoglucosamine sulfohydrolase